jgi:hypothetical protein
VRGILVAVTTGLDKELFDGDVLFEHGVLGFVGTAEASATNEADNSVFASLKEGVVGEVHANVFL